jgi:hypothetical protein
MRLQGLVALLSFLGLHGASRAEGCPAELFRVARSTNANVVVYEANLDEAGGIDAREPVRAVWLMNAGDGRREDLTFLERSLAYGFDVRAAAPHPGFWLTLKAQEKRPIHVRDHDGCPCAFTTISGRSALLRRIYVQAGGGGLLPSVRSVTLFGSDAETGDALHETIGASN